MKRNLATTAARALAVGLTLATPACGTKAEPPEPAAAPAAGPAATAGADVPMVTNFGVPECDAYVEKYTSCLEGKVSAEAKQGLLDAFQLNRNKWRAMATMKESASTLAVVCRVATQKAKEELSEAYGCDF